MNDKLELSEEYNQDGVCIKRLINGIDLPADTEPSVVIFNRDFTSYSRKCFMTREEARNLYPELLL